MKTIIAPRTRMRFALALLVFTMPLRPAVEAIPSAVYHQRRLALAAKLEHGAALLFADFEANPDFPFRQDSNFYYLTGWTHPGAVLLLVAPRPEEKRPYAEILFLPKKSDMTARTTVNQVDVISHLGTELQRHGIRATADLYTDTTQPSRNAAPILSWLQKSTPLPGTPRNVAPILNLMRAVKDQYEIELIRKATSNSVQAHLAAMRAVKPGLFERDIASLMENQLEKLGCQRPAYYSIAASGANAADSHYHANSSLLKSGDLIYLDIAGEYSMYAADVARTLPISGRYTQRQRELYRLVRGAELAILQSFRAGHSALNGPGSLHSVYENYMRAHGLAKFSHNGVGHPVGLDVHDSGERGIVYNAPLVPGSVFNIEPNIYLPEEKLGIGIEETFLVGRDGKLICLTAGLPVEPEDIERVMAARSK